MWHDYSTFSHDGKHFILPTGKMCNLFVGNTFPGDTEYLVSALVEYTVHIQVTKSKKSGSTSVYAVIATLLYFFFPKMLLDPLFLIKNIST